jgi:hypothetical protein
MHALENQTAIIQDTQTDTEDGSARQNDIDSLGRSFLPERSKQESGRHRRRNKAQYRLEDIEEVLKDLRNELLTLRDTKVIEPGYEDVFNVLRLEDQLFAEIRALDVNNEFYYSVPVEDRLAIEFNESDKKLNTLMNPLMNYDINNVNNKFVISKLDIDYLNSGIQVARSSRLS